MVYAPPVRADANLYRVICYHDEGPSSKVTRQVRRPR